MAQEFRISEIKYGQTLTPVNEEQVAFYKREFAAGRAVAPILVDANMALLEGRHRLEAAKSLNLKTISGDFHIATPLDLPGRKEIAAAISAATAGLARNIKIVDRRDPASIRTELENFQHRRGLLEKDRAYCAASVVEVTGKLVALRALKKKYATLAETAPHYGRAVDEAAGKIAKLEPDLAFAKDRESRLQKIVDSIDKQIENFLAHTPGKGFPTNAGLLQEANEIKKMERELAAL
ncbi:MAG: hypothetical protein WB562_02925 [Candidatus Sulfotelmatobacter sp.]